MKAFSGTQYRRDDPNCQAERSIARNSEANITAINCRGYFGSSELRSSISQTDGAAPRRSETQGNPTDELGERVYALCYLCLSDERKPCQQ